LEHIPVVDKPNPKIAVSDLEKLEKLLDETPAHHAIAVSKRDAIFRLAPRLYDMHAKGYSWGAVAGWLSEHGVIVSRSVLGEYLRRALASTPHGAARRQKTRRLRSAEASDVPSDSPSALHRSIAGHTSPQPDSAATATSSRPSPGRLVPGGFHEGSRRSDFAVRPDSEEI
jgi:hypothetical protein